MTAPAAPTADLTLDACAALRADVAAQGAPPDAPTSAAADGAVDVAGAWLLLVTSLERAAQLPPKRRPAHFRRASAVWDDAAQVLGEPRYASVGVRLARWRTTDPTLPLVRELLWAIEQPEAAGYVRLALAGCEALGRLLPAADVRRGYVLAQSARALRTLGDLDSARERYEVSKALANKRRDSWLRVRSAIGLGATYHQSGNLPAARAVFTEILVRGAPDARFTAAAHQGLLHCALGAQDPSSALEHAWYLLRASREGVFPRIDAWTLMASVCEGLGRYRAAAHMAEAVLRHATRPDDIAVSLQTLVATAAATCDLAGGRPYARALRSAIGVGASTYDDVRSLLALAEFEHTAGDTAMARSDLARGYGMAAARGLHELVFRAEQLTAAWESETPSRPGAGIARHLEKPHLPRHSARIIRQVSAWDCEPEAEVSSNVSRACGGAAVS